MTAANVVIACLEPAAPEDCASQILKTLGLDAQPSAHWRRFGSTLLVAWPPPLRDDPRQSLRGLPGLRRVIHLPDGQPLYARWPLGACSTVELAPGLRCGGSTPLVIAGPCSVETEAQTLETAALVAEAGAQALRGGVFKPRTTPYCFGGLGEPGLAILQRAREQTGLPVVSEVLDLEHADPVAAAVDVIQIGSRNMHNSTLLFRLGAHRSGRPVLLKRGFGATVDELLHAAEYVLLGRLAAGRDEPGLLLCERGIRSFGQTTRYTLDPAVVPVIHQRSHLPVIVDPSHPAGSPQLVPALARAALAAGADGLLVEVHPEPERAWCDGGHALDFTEFRELMAAAHG